MHTVKIALSDHDSSLYDFKRKYEERALGNSSEDITTSTKHQDFEKMRTSPLPSGRVRKLVTYDRSENFLLQSD